MGSPSYSILCACNKSMKQFPNTYPHCGKRMRIKLSAEQNLRWSLCLVRCHERRGLHECIQPPNVILKMVEYPLLIIGRHVQTCFSVFNQYCMEFFYSLKYIFNAITLKQHTNTGKRISFKKHFLVFLFYSSNIMCCSCHAVHVFVVGASTVKDGSSNNSNSSSKYS